MVLRKCRYGIEAYRSHGWWVPVPDETSGKKANILETLRGKALAQRIIPELEGKTAPKLNHDSSTNNLIRHYRKMK